MRSKVASLLLVVLMVLASFAPALAQSEPFCGDLDAADCDLLTAATENMKEVASYQAAASYSAMLAGIPGLPLAEAAVDVTVDGAFTYNDDALAAAAQLAEVQGQEDVANLMLESPELFVDFYNGWAFDMVIDVTMSDELAAALSADAGIEIPSALSVPLILKDGILYVDVTEVAPLINGMQGMEGWLGFEFGRVIEAAAEQGMFEQAAASMDPAAMASAGAADPATMAALMGLQATLSDPKAFEKFMSIERVADDEIDGAAVAVFVTKLDLLAFLSSPEFAELVKGLAASGALGADAPSAADLDQALGMLGMMGPMLFQGLTSESTTAVSIDEPNYIISQSTLFSWDLTSLLQMAAMSGAVPADQLPSGASMVEVSTTVVNSDIGGEQMIEAPADAQIIPAEAMMQPAQ
ncbi:MAG TPA: hypothetical protein GYA08_05020 [Chloroflexi bacterium]|nr:hypothetical protein [Chloroflexota bacterium]